MSDSCATSEAERPSPAAPVPPPGRHGGDGPALARAMGLDPDALLDLSLNLNPFAPDLTPIVGREARAVRRYPDAAEATTLLADAMDVEPGRLLVTNGGSEAIALVAAEIGGRVAGEPDFALYPRGATGPIWRSDPHNPSGSLAAPDRRADVWDEAFYPLATGRWSARRTGLIVGSLTKLFAMPGLRIGYIVADDVERFSRRQPQWSVSTLALAVLPHLLDLIDLSSWCAGISRHRADLADLFSERGFGVTVADAPWILVHGRALRQTLAAHGIVVRDCATFGWDRTARVAVPDAAGLERVATALRHIEPEPA